MRINKYVVSALLVVTTLASQQAYSAAEGRVYYVDSKQGDDSNDGLSKENPWKSLAKVNAGTFQAGDRVLFRAGTVFEGQLKPQGSGRMIDGRPVPIIVDRYGEGERPRIDAKGRFAAALHLHNVEYWEINGLEITNQGPEQQGKAGYDSSLKGVYVQITDYGTASHIHLKDLYIHDVNGSLYKGTGSGGIRYWFGGDKQPSRLNGFLVEGCHIKRCTRDGIEGRYGPRGNTKRGVDWFPSLNAIFRNNLIEEVPGDGIVPVGFDGAIVEHNVVRNSPPLPYNPYRAAAGIWPWGCDNTLIQFNEVSGYGKGADAQGFDSDFNCLNTIFQYNYSHDNWGGFLLVCNRGPKAKDKNYDSTQINIGTIARYNVSYNDGPNRIFHLNGPVEDTKIYNNVIYVTKDSNPPMIQMGNWGGPWPTDTWFANNIFYVEGKVSYEWGGGEKPLFENNLFYGEHQNGPNDPHALTADPLFASPISPDSTAAGFETLRRFMLQKGSPAIGAGIAISSNGDRDLFGHSLPQELPPSIGVHEFKRAGKETSPEQNTDHQE